MKSKKTAATWAILVLASIQGPLIYYYGNGFSVFLVAYPCMLIGFALSLYLILSLRKKESNSTFIIVGGVLGIVLGIASLFSENVIEKVDWTLRRNTREYIVMQVKQGKIEGDLPGWYFPPISNAANGNIYVTKSTDTTVSVTFFINSGFLDHYSAFVYTNEPATMQSIETYFKDGKRGGFVKLDTNWYRVNY